MRSFVGITNNELTEKIRSMAATELGEALNEIISRQIRVYREDADSVTLEGLPLLQGKIQQLKDLQLLLNIQAVPRKGQQGENK